MGDFNVYEAEAKDGVRFAWNVWPNNRIDAARMAVPLSCVYTPVKKIPEMGQVDYEPVQCKKAGCGCILNPYCQVEFQQMLWVCPFCLTRNHFPPGYREISNENMPAECYQQYSTIEYVRNVAPTPPVFLFVVDTCVPEHELTAVKNSIEQALDLMPQTSLVGLITFGRNVHVHELSFEECAKSYVFNGSKAIDSARVSTLLGLNPPAGMQPTPEWQQGQASRFLMPVADGEFQLRAILDDLSPDEWEHPGDQRPDRCTGTAMAVAVGLLEATYKAGAARACMFLGGPPTIGPGLVVSPDLKDHIRSHNDLREGEAPHYLKAQKFYESLADRAMSNGHAIDIFACALDQFGLAEMKVCLDRTGGLLVLDDSFSKKREKIAEGSVEETGGTFQGSLRQVFVADPETKDLDMAFNAQLRVLTSREYKVSGAIGLCTSREEKSHVVADTETGVGGTASWGLGAIDPNTSIGLYFEVASNAQDQQSAAQQQRYGYLQLVTTYKHSSGRIHQRVTTVVRPFSDLKSDQGLASISYGFDQEAAVVLMARLAVWKTENEYAPDVLRWLDRMLIRLVSKFATYQKDQPNSLRLSEHFIHFPIFLYHFRRSQFMSIFNSSPDETAFYRCVLQRENVANTVNMVRPVLMSYHMETGVQPVQLDVKAVQKDGMLLLDTFFNVVVFWGDTVHRWYQDGVHENPDFAHFGDFLQQIEGDAETLMASRFPYPKYVKCVEGGSQARFIMAKLNPSVTLNTNQALPPDQAMVLTDDVSLEVFLSHLNKLAVSSS